MLIISQRLREMKLPLSFRKIHWHVKTPPVTYCYIDIRRGISCLLLHNSLASRLPQKLVLAMEKYYRFRIPPPWDVSGQILLKGTKVPLDDGTLVLAEDTEVSLIGKPAGQCEVWRFATLPAQCVRQLCLSFPLPSFA